MADDIPSPNLRVAIDARCALRPNLTGIGRYASELLAAMCRLGLHPRRYWNPTEAGAVDGLAATDTGGHWRAVLGRRGWLTIHAPLSLLRDRIEVFHVLDGMPPFVSPCAVVVTVYDLSFVEHPEWFPPGQAEALQRGTAQGLKRARRIIAISEFTRSRIMARCGIDADRIDVTPLAASADMRPVGDPAALRAIREKYGLAERYILHVGAIQPRKNLATLVRAHDLAFGGCSDPPQLLLAGPTWANSDDVAATIAQSSCRDHVKLAGYVPEADKPALYSAALCLAYPSLYEGFGLPPLEAMACGTPTVTSNGSSLPEVVGDAALTVAPGDVQGMAEALARLATDAQLRARLRKAGLSRAALFSWERTAALTWASYLRACVRG